MTRRDRCLLVSIILISIIICTYYLGQKSGYYVDEGMTLVLSNGHYNGTVTSSSDYGVKNFIQEYILSGDGSVLINIKTNISSMLMDIKQADNYSREGSVRWYDDARNMLQGSPKQIFGEELFRQLVAQKGERFRYGQVYINQALDVHPILYYVIVHTVFSLFAGIYSDAFCFAINIVFLVLTSIFLYKLVVLLWKDKIQAFASVFLFCTSQGYVSCAMYFRMYAMLTFMVILALYVHAKILTTDGGCLETRKARLTLFFSVLLGLNTHYYYIIFLVPLACVLFICLVKDKLARRRYLRGILLSGVTSLVIWPFSLYHILFGYRGTQARSNLISSLTTDKLRQSLEVIKSAFFCGSTYVMLGACGVILLLTVYAIVQKKKKIFTNMSHEQKQRLSILFIPGLFYFFVVIQVAPEISDRYIMCLFPIMAMLLAAVIIGLAKECCIKLYNSNLKVLLIIVGFVCIQLFIIHPNYLFLAQKDMTLTIDDPQEYDCIYIGWDHGQGFANAVALSRFSSVLVVGRDELEGLEYDINEDKTLIYIIKSLDPDDIMTKLGLQLQDWEITSSDIDYFDAYITK